MQNAEEIKALISSIEKELQEIRELLSDKPKNGAFEKMLHEAIERGKRNLKN